MKKDIRRQNFTNQITPSGGFYFFRWNIFKRKKMFYTEKTKGYLVSEMSSINIDNQYDWIVADLLARNVIDKKDIYNLIK